VQRIKENASLRNEKFKFDCTEMEKVLGSVDLGFLRL
jgi:hypothetical protein